MSATNTRQPQNKETDSLIDAAVGYQLASDELAYLQRAAARIALNALDNAYPPSMERSRVRTRILDTLAWYSKEVNRWACSLQAETSQPPSNKSTDSSSD